MKHVCHGCHQVPIDPKLLVCPWLWSKVPADVQNQVWATYRRGQETES